MSEEVGKYELQRASGEKALQDSIVQALQLMGWRVYGFGKPGGHGALGGAVPNRGWPDLLAVKYGLHLWIEVKLLDGKVTREQEECHRELAAAGALVFVARSVDGALGNATQALATWLASGGHGTSGK